MPSDQAFALGKADIAGYRAQAASIMADQKKTISSLEATVKELLDRQTLIDEQERSLGKLTQSTAVKEQLAALSQEKAGLEKDLDRWHAELNQNKSQLRSNAKRLDEFNQKAAKYSKPQKMMSAALEKPPAPPSRPGSVAAQTKPAVSGVQEAEEYAKQLEAETKQKVQQAETTMKSALIKRLDLEQEWVPIRAKNNALVKQLHDNEDNIARFTASQKKLALMAFPVQDSVLAKSFDHLESAQNKVKELQLNFDKVSRQAPPQTIQPLSESLDKAREALAQEEKAHKEDIANLEKMKNNKQFTATERKAMQQILDAQKQIDALTQTQSAIEKNYEQFKSQEWDPLNAKTIEADNAYKAAQEKYRVMNTAQKQSGKPRPASEMPPRPPSGASSALDNEGKLSGKQ